MFDDKDWAAKVMEDAQIDCRFTKEFVDLAAGCKEIVGNEHKAKELIEQGEQFAMTGEDNVELARGFLHVERDKAAAGAYEKALGDARKVYEEGRERLQDPLQQIEWAEGILEVFRDEGWAREVYDGLEQALSDAQAKAVLHTSRKYRLERML